MNKILSVVVFVVGVFIPIIFNFNTLALILFSGTGGVISRILWDYDKE